MLGLAMKSATDSRNFREILISEQKDSYNTIENLEV